MRRLILMRHAKSSWDDPLLSDFDRPLNARGQRSAPAMGAWLRKKGHLPDAALVSAAQRTGETFVGTGFDCPVRFSRALYHASAVQMADALRHETAQTVLLIGHNPGIADCAAWLLRAPPAHPRFFDYPTCATLVADFDVPNWNDLAWSKGEVVDFAIPREIMA